MTHEEITQLADEIASRIALYHKDTMNIEEVSIYTGLSKNQIYRLTSDRTIPHSKPNGKTVYFSRAEIDQWLMSNPIATTTDINSRAIAYTMMLRNGHRRF